MVCAHFATKDYAHFERGLNTDFHFAAVICGLGNLKKIMG